MQQPVGERGPASDHDLDDLNRLRWVTTIELSASAVAVLAIGPVIDTVGTRLVSRTVLVAFVLSAVLSALAPNRVCPKCRRASDESSDLFVQRRLVDEVDMTQSAS